MAEASSRSQSPIDSQNQEELNLNCPPEKPKFKYTYRRSTLAKTVHLENVPFSWDKHQVEQYIKKYTDGRGELSSLSATDREKIWMTQTGIMSQKKRNYLKIKFDSGEIAESIDEIILKKNEENSTCLCRVIFKTYKMAQDAKHLLCNVKEFDPPIAPKFYRPGQEDEPNTSAATRSRSRSPLTSENQSVKKKQNYYRALLIKNLHTSWNKTRIEIFLKKLLREEIMNSIRFVFLLKDNQKKFNGKCVVLFANADVCKEARTILKKSVIREGMNIWVDYDYQKSVVWRENDTPDFYAIKHMPKDNAETVEKEESVTRTPRKRTNENKTIWNRQSKINYNSNFIGNQSQDNCYNQTFKNDLMLANQDHQFNETYGLSPQLLASYDIIPPLGTKIYVANLPLDYDDETKIRKFFSYAGMVLSVAIIARHNALQVKVEFDHPIEAVQAITMFKNQEVFGKRLVVQMDRSHHANKRYLPDGLKAFGPGLGPSGLPLKGVRSTIELQNVKNMLMKEIENLKRQIYQGNDGKSANSDNQSMIQQNQSVMSSLVNPVENNPLLALGALLNPQAAQVLQLLSQQNSGNTLSAVLNAAQNQGIDSKASSWNLNQVTEVSQSSPLNIRGGSNTQGNMQSGLNAGNIQSAMNVQSGLNTQCGSNMQSGISTMTVQGGLNTQDMQQGVSNMRGTTEQVRSYMQDVFNRNRNLDNDASCSVTFNYLPPSVNLLALKSKVSEIADIKMANMIGPGRAVVVFHRPSDAEACVKLFDRTKVDGQMIDVRLL